MIAADTSTKPANLLAILLAVLFIGLKLTGFIAWSWWWVLAPLWIGFAIAIVILLILGVIAAAMVTGK